MPLFTLHRNFTMRTLYGHAIMFVKDKEVEVPDVCVHDAIAIGARQVTGEKVDNLGEEVEIICLSPQERKDKVFEAFRIMKGRGERLDFTGTGVPNAKRMFPLMGFEITSNERNTLWQEFRDMESEAQMQTRIDAKIAAA